MKKSQQLCFVKLCVYLCYLDIGVYMKKEIEYIFTLLWYKEDDADIWIMLYQLGMQPASHIATKLKRERTWVYKTLRTMAREGLISQTKKKWVTQFWIKDPHMLFGALDRQKQELEKMSEQQEDISQWLVQFESHRYPHLPKISLYDGVAWMTSLYQDIYDTAMRNNYLVIKFFASNTFESQTSVDTTIKDYAKDTFTKLKKKNVTVETFLGNGILIMEHISKTTHIENLADLPAGNSAINIFVVGKVLYLIIFKDIPFGIKIDSEDVANTMHFLFEKLEVE